MKKHHLQCILIILGVFWISASVVTATGNHPTKAISKFNQSYFIPNRPDEYSGKRLVENESVMAFLQTPRGRIFFTNEGAFFNVPTLVSGFSKPRGRGDVQSCAERRVVMRSGFGGLCRIKTDRHTELLEETGALLNFLVGERDNWRVGVPAYRALKYADIWPGIDVEYRESSGGLSIQLNVKPGADLGSVVMETGATALILDGEGNLMAESEGAYSFLTSPIAFQKHGEGQSAVRVSVRVLPGGRYTVSASDYNHSRPLFITQTLSWGTFLGGAGQGYDQANGIVRSASDEVYLCGNTSSEDFPTTSGAYQPSFNGKGFDAFIAMLSPDGARVEWCTYLGGTSDEYCEAISVDSMGNAVVAGLSYSQDFPVTAGALDNVATQGEAFVAKLDQKGTHLLWSTYLGGSQWDAVCALSLDYRDNVILLGTTASPDFPTTSWAYDQSHNGYGDAFISILSSDGTHLLHSTFLGGSGNDLGISLVQDQTGDLIVAGTTSSINFPVTEGSYDTSYSGYYDVFIARLSPDASSLIFATYLGGSKEEHILHGLALGPDGSVVVGGSTDSSDFPITPGAFDTTFAGSDAFISQLSADGTHLLGSTFLGGSSWESCDALAVDAEGNTIAVGSTASPDFPVTPGAYDPGLRDGYITKLKPGGTALLWSCCLENPGENIVLDSQDNPIVAGRVLAEGASPNDIDILITKLSMDGRALIWSKTLGGRPGSSDSGRSVAPDADGNLVVCGQTGSGNFPVSTGVFDPEYNGGSDLFVTKMDADGTRILWSTYLGGSKDDVASSMVLDVSGDIFLTGSTYSPDFPVTPGAFDTVCDACYYGHAFALKLESDGTQLAWATYLGGSKWDTGYALALDAQNNVVLAGRTYSADFPVTPGCYDSGFNGYYTDAWVSKLSADGSDLLWSTFLGGTGADVVYGLTLDASGNAILVGDTDSFDFPVTTGAFDTSFNGGAEDQDTFVTKLSSDGSKVVWSTFLGGSDSDYGGGVVLDASGDLFLSGSTLSADFPVSDGAYDTTYSYNDIFITRLTGDGSHLVWSSFLGGTYSERGAVRCLDSDGNLLLIGCTSSPDFPTTGGALDTTYNGRTDAVIAKISKDGSRLLWSTYLGGTGDDYGAWMARDSFGNLLVTGQTNSSDFPVTPEAYDPVIRDGYDAFVVKMQEIDLDTVSDFDHDGISDILWRHESTGAISGWLLSVHRVKDTLGPGSVVDPDWQLVGIGDISGDGYDDLLWRHTLTGTLSVWLIEPGGSVSEMSPGTVDPSWKVVGLADADGDGKADIYWRNDVSGMMSVWYIDETGLKGTGFVGGIGSTDWQMIGVADFNGDGKGDILWRQRSTGMLTVWFLDGNGYASSMSPGTAESSWKIVGLGDVDGDLKADIFWCNDTDGAVFLWLLNELGVKGTVFIGTIYDPDWQVSGIGDFDGDGRSDLLWRNSFTGVLSIWYLNASGLVRQMTPGSVDLSWQTQNHVNFAGAP